MTLGPGLTLAVNWLHPPPGDVAIDLMADAGATFAFHVATVPGTSQKGYCDAGQGLGVAVQGTNCGRYETIIPEAWTTPGNYSVRVQSVQQPDVAGYTDIVLIKNDAPGAMPNVTTAVPVPITGAPTSTATAGNDSDSPTASPTAPLSPGGTTPTGAPTSSANGTSTATAPGGSSSSGAPAGSSNTPNSGESAFTIPQGTKTIAMAAGMLAVLVGSGFATLA